MVSILNSSGSEEVFLLKNIIKIEIQKIRCVLTLWAELNFMIFSNGVMWSKLVFIRKDKIVVDEHAKKRYEPIKNTYKQDL